MNRVIRDDRDAISSVLFFLIGMVCFILHCICVWHIGVFADEFGRFSWTSFYGGVLWNAADMAFCAFFIILAVGGSFYERMGRAFKAAFFIFSCFTLVLAIKIRYSNYAFAAGNNIPIWDVFGGKVYFGLVLIEIAMILLFCILSAIALLAKGKSNDVQAENE